MQRNVYVMALAFALAVIFGGCGSSNEHEYRPGDFVKHKIDGRVGIIISTVTLTSDFMVRFPAQQTKSNTHLLSSDGPIEQAPYADVICRPFELEPAERPKPIASIK